MKNNNRVLALGFGGLLVTFCCILPFLVIFAPVYTNLGSANPGYVTNCSTNNDPNYTCYGYDFWQECTDCNVKSPQTTGFLKIFTRGRNGTNPIFVYETKHFWFGIDKDGPAFRLNK